MRRLVVALAVAIAVAPAAGARTTDAYCCVDAHLGVSYDAGRATISARWGSPLAGAAAVEIRAGDRLDAHGVVDRSSPRSVATRLAGGSSYSVPARAVAVVLATHASVFVQVRFACPGGAAAGACASGSFWSRPVSVTADEPAAGATKKSGNGITVNSRRVTIQPNGTQACLDWFAKLGAIGDKITANTRAAKTAADAGQSTAPFAKKQSTLKALYAVALTAAQRACTK